MGFVRTVAGVVKIGLAITLFFGLLGGASFGVYLHIADNASLSDFEPDSNQTTLPTDNQSPTTPTAAPSYTLNASWDTKTDPNDPGISAFQTAKQNVTSPAVEYYIHQKVNKFRQQHGRSPLTNSHYISSVARAHSADMAKQSFFSHINPAGESPWERFGQSWDTACPAGYSENIAANWLGTKSERPDGSAATARTAEEIATVIVEQWKHSSQHRSNMLNQNWTAVGTGVYIYDRGTAAKVYATQNFCGRSNTSE